jgi:hypothetical protein
MNERKTEPRELSGKSRLNYAVDFLTLLLILAMIGTGIVIRYVLPPGSGGHGGGERLLLWGLDRHEWGGLHFWLAVALSAVMLLHVALHWKWICGITRRWIGRVRGGGVRASRRAAYGVAFFALVALLVGGFTYLSWTSVEVVPGDHHGRGRHSRRSVASVGQGSDAAHELEAVPETPRHEEDGRPSSRGGGRARPKRADEHREHHHHADGALVRGSMSLREVARVSGFDVSELKELLGLPATVSGSERLGRLKRRFGFEIEDVRKLIAERQRGD